MQKLFFNHPWLKLVPWGLPCWSLWNLVNKSLSTLPGLLGYLRLAPQPSDGWTWASSIFGLLKPNETKNISVGPQVKKINEPAEWRFRLSLEISVQSSSMVNEVGKCLPCFQGKKVYHKDFIIRKQWIQTKAEDRYFHMYRNSNFQEPFL